MTNEKIEKYKNKLQKERAAIVQDIADLEKPIDLNTDIDHGEGKTDEATELSDQAGEDNDLKTRLDDIDSALEKIEKGDYGICESCGKEIEDEVLDVDFESRLCKECKTKNQLANIL